MAGRRAARAGLRVVAALAAVWLTGGLTPPTEAAGSSAREAPAAGLGTAAVLGWSPGVTRDVPLMGPLSVTFNRTMNQASVQAAWTLSPSAPGAFRWTGTTVSFTPSHPLRAGSFYHLTVGAGARGADGAPLAGPFSVSFATGDALRVSSYAPSNGTRGVPVNGLIAVTFSHPMVALAGLSGGTGNPPGWAAAIRPSLVGHGSWLGTSTWVFRPDRGLAPSTAYTVTLSGKARDAWGEPLGRDLRWSFRTVTPEVFSRSPRNRQRFADPRRPVVVTFNQPMDRASTARAFSLRTGGAAVAGSISWAAQDTRLVFHPRAALNAGTPYTVTVGAAARSANGRATLGKQERWGFQAAPAPAVAGTGPNPGGTVYSSLSMYFGNGPPISFGYAVSLDFSAPMSKESLDRHLTISPSISQIETAFYGPDESGRFVYSIYGDFKPSAHYTVALGSGVHDAFNRPLPGPYTFSFKTARLSPSVAFYGMGGAGPGIAYSAGRVVDAPIQLVNVPRVSYQLVRTSLAALASCCNGGPPAGTTVRSWSVSTPHPLDKVENLGVKLAQKDGSPLPPGIYWLGASAPDNLKGLAPNAPPPNGGEVVLVRNVTLTEKTAGNGTFVWVTSAQTGNPLAGVRVRLLNYQGVTVASGTTGAQGMHVFHSFPSNQGQPSAEADGKGYFGLTQSYWSPGVWSPGSGTPPWAWFGGPSSGGTYLYTDRPVYRPGQRVHFRGILWRDQDGVYAHLGPLKATVRATDSNGHSLFHTQVALDRFGAVHGSFRLPAGAATGIDNIWVGVRNGPGAGVGFTVAEYRKPEFLTTVTSGAPSYVQGQTLTATVKVQYVFGAPVVRQQVSWTAYAQPTFPPPPGWDGYSFFDWESLWQGMNPFNNPTQQGSQFGAQVAQGTGKTDGQGKLTVRLPVDLAKEIADRTVTLEATTTDISHQSVSGRVQVPEYRSGLAIGLSAEHGVVPAGTEAAVDVVAVTQEGKPLAGQSLTATIYKRTYSSKLVSTGAGQTGWQEVPHDSQVGTQSLTTDGSGKATVTFTPRDGGEYRVVVSGKDGAGNPAQNALSVYASAQGFNDWSLQSDTSIGLKPDKTTYSVGDTAHVLVAAPFDHATALVTVERGAVRRYWVRHLDTSSPTVDIPISLDDLPNVYVTVTLYHGWRGSDPPDWRYGVTELHVRVDPRHLMVHLAQNGSRHHPGDVVTYTVTTRDAQGRPVSAQLSLALVDTAVLALQDETNPDILKALYSDRNLSVSTASDGTLSIDHLQTKPNFPIGTSPYGAKGTVHEGAAAPLGLGGGGGGAPPQTTTVRSRFADTAYWSGSLVTGSSGRATLRIRLPDNATTWRLDARGVTASDAVGQAQLRTLATQDLVLRPVLPRFLVEGDRLQVGTVLNDNLDRPVDAVVSLVAPGMAVYSGSRYAVHLGAHGEKLFLWRVGVPEGRTSATFFLRASPTTGGVRGDAVRLSVPVHPPLTDETVATAGQVLGSARQLVIVPRNAMPRPGALTVQVSASLAAGLGAAYGEFRPSQYESNEDVADRVLAAASLRSLPLSITGLKASTYRGLPLVVAAGVQKLLDHQYPEGSWPWFNGPYAPGDPEITADAVQALVASGRRGLLVRSAIRQGRQYIQSQLGTVPATERAHLLLVLALSGPAPRALLESFYGNSVQRLHLDPGPLAELGRALSMGRDAAKARTLVSVLDGRAVVSATGAHWESDPWNPWAGPVVDTTAAVLTALVSLSPHDPYAPAAARWLMLARQGSGWDCSHDSAQAIAALTAYAQAAREGTADYQYRVEVDGRTGMSGGYTPATQRRVSTLSVPVGRLHRSGSSSLVIARQAQNGVFGSGPLYYVARLHYYLRANAIAPRSEGISVSRRYLDLQGHPIHAVKAGAAIQVELTVHAASTLLYLDVDDPIPSGLEPIDETLNTSQQGLFRPPPFVPFGPTQDLGAYLQHTDLRDDEVSLYSYYLPPGTYRYTYLAQATVPGSYGVPPTHAQEAFFPEVFGRGAGQTFTVR